MLVTIKHKTKTAHVNGPTFTMMVVGLRALHHQKECYNIDRVLVFSGDQLGCRESAIILSSNDGGIGDNNEDEDDDETQ